MNFEAHPFLRHPHVMTIAGAAADIWRRRALRSTAEDSVFQVDAESAVLGHCHWQPDRISSPTLVLTHGLTGDANAGYMIGTAKKAFSKGFNTIRLNVRNCGGTEALTPTLYHTGLSGDLRAVIETLAAENFRAIYCAGYSMGGNITLKMAGEYGFSPPPWLKGVAAISPPIDLARASAAIDSGVINRIYQEHFLRSLRALVRRKAAAHPSRYDLRGLSRIRTLRAYDDRYVAACFNFRGADDYYAQASAGPLLDRIAVPVLIIHARDDSIIPFDPFATLAHERLTLIATHTGGHAGFIGRRGASDPDAYWAENRLVEWLESQRPLS